ncbi:hypothetical protein IHE44_0006739 [Lamprotornis superbus]|uniref:Uncharacterized protein n=1 Tax=Lamprotornis superbus TaxID=245042 RepID=A0A835NH66_9PASS|nr:hypothetical protein IHE44_0006739 [Lamprotornis superbus]
MPSVTEQVSSQHCLPSLAEIEQGGIFLWSLAGSSACPDLLSQPMFWECCHTCELPLGLSDAVTHLSCAGGLSGYLHFSQSLLTLLLAKGLPEFPGFRSAGCPETQQCQCW